MFLLYGLGLQLCGVDVREELGSLLMQITVLSIALVQVLAAGMWQWVFLGVLH